MNAPLAKANPVSPRALHARAAAWLWARQAPDGAWRSETYGLLRSGQALTPFLLLGLLEVPEADCPRPAGGLERALAFVRAGVNSDGLSGLTDRELPEYPTYTTAYALRCLLTVGEARDLPLIERMCAALAGAQLGPDLEPDHPASGGWGFGLRPPGQPGHMDVCHTWHALDALGQAGRITPSVRAQAEAFLRFVQRHPDDPRPQPPFDQQAADRAAVPYDGGFYFSPVVLAASKGGVADAGGVRYCASYATATCEGLLALLAAGVSADDERAQDARRWLNAHPRLDHPEGIPADDPSGWAESVRFSHLSARAVAWSRVGGPSGWRRALSGELAARQRADGSFLNARGHLMKEDDPLLCTGLALSALGSVRARVS